MAVEIAVLIIACGAITAGYGYVRLARQMCSYRTVEGHVTGREVAVIPGGIGGEGRWGYTSDRWSYASNGVRRDIAEQQLAAVPDTFEVFFDPNAPDQAYLHTHPPRVGYWLLVGGVIAAIAAVVALFS